jgi:hypothetical protein
VDKQLEDLKTRKKTAAADQAKNFDKTIDTFVTRRDDLKKKLAAQKATNAARVFKAELVNLGTDVTDEPEMLAAVNAHLASYPEPHAPPPPSALAPPQRPVPPVPPQK